MVATHVKRPLEGELDNDYYLGKHIDARHQGLRGNSENRVTKYRSS